MLVVASGGGVGKSCSRGGCLRVAVYGRFEPPTPPGEVLAGSCIARASVMPRLLVRLVLRPRLVRVRASTRLLAILRTVPVSAPSQRAQLANYLEQIGVAFASS